MKLIYALFLLTFSFFALTGCNNAEKISMQSQIGEMQRTIKDLSGSNLLFQAKLSELSSSNLFLQGQLLAVQEKVKSGGELNTLLRQQLDSATAQVAKSLETAKANAEQEKLKPIEESIRALRQFDSSASASITFDEYRKKLQDLKVVLDENNRRIEGTEIKQPLFLAYADYEDAYIVWAASLGNEVGDWKSALKTHGHWSKVPEDSRESYERMAKNASSSEVTAETMYNYTILKYAVGPCLRSCSSSARTHVAEAEQKLKKTPQP